MRQLHAFSYTSGKSKCFACTTCRERIGYTHMLRARERDQRNRQDAPYC